MSKELIPFILSSSEGLDIKFTGHSEDAESYWFLNWMMRSRWPESLTLSLMIHTEYENIKSHTLNISYSWRKEVFILNSKTCGITDFNAYVSKEIFTESVAIALGLVEV